MDSSFFGTGFHELMAHRNPSIPVTAVVLPADPASGDAAAAALCGIVVPHRGAGRYTALVGPDAAAAGHAVATATIDHGAVAAHRWWDDSYIFTLSSG